MDRVSFDVDVPVLLHVVIAGVIDVSCFEEESPFTSVGSDREGVCSSDPEILLDSIPIYTEIVHREKDSPPVFAKGIDFLADIYPSGSLRGTVMMGSSKEFACLGDLIDCDKTFLSELGGRRITLLLCKGR